MPGKNYKKYSSKKSSFKKKNFTRKTYRAKKTSGFKSLKGTDSSHNTVIIRGRDIMPETLITRCEYMEQVYFTAVTSGQAYIYRGNGAYDPNQTGTGQQPHGFALMNSWYTYYECPSCYIRIEYVNNSNVPMWLTITPVVNSADAVSYNSAQARPGSRYTYVEGNQSSAHGVITNRANSKEILGLNSGTTDFRALFNSVPGQQWYWNIHLDSVDGASSISGVLNVKLIYQIKFTGRKLNSG